MFGEVVGRVTGAAVGRAREGVALLLSGRLMRYVAEWKKVTSRLMWVRVKREREIHKGYLVLSLFYYVSFKFIFSLRF